MRLRDGFGSGPRASIMSEHASAGLVFEGTGLVDDHAQPAPWPRFGVIGDPIVHSASPRLHRAALAACGLPGDYDAIRVRSHDLHRFLDRARQEGVVGLNVTAPHKTAVLAACPRRSEEAISIGAANTLVERADGWQAHNTDARGLALALDRAAGRRLTAYLRRAVVLGAGGAARAAFTCLVSLGARELVVMARSVEKAVWVEQRGGRVVPWGSALLADATLVVQCTPVGWRPEDASPVDPEVLGTDCLVADLVYASRRTRLLDAAARRGCRTMDGLPMLVAQAALSFALWNGADAPLEAMAQAVGLQW
jgi:shikimate dehydrogenase